MTPDVIVVGGGVAGLAAAVGIAREGGTALLLERAANPGGRTASHRDRVTGEMVDNGQHVLLGSYHATLDYLRAIGADHLLRSRPTLSLPFHHPERGTATFRLPALPVPIDLPAGVISYRHLDASAKAGLLRAGAWLRSWSGAKEERIRGWTVARWLDERGQGRRARECFWDPIAVSVMNALPEEASALLFVRALRAAFLGKGADSRMLIPTVCQQELYAAGALRFLRSRGSRVVTSAHVAGVELDGGRAAGVRLADGSRVDAGAVVLAVPSWAVAAILPGDGACGDLGRSAGALGTSPIVSMNLWYDRDFMEGEMLGLVGSEIQWIFNRRAILAGGEGGSLSCVISAARDAVELPAAELIRRAGEEVRRVFPGAAGARLVHATAHKERRATFAPTPEAESLRPGPVTPVRGLLLAGDWTDTGLPATIEGAALSGFAAARLALRG